MYTWSHCNAISWSTLARAHLLMAVIMHPSVPCPSNSQPPCVRSYASADGIEVEAQGEQRQVGDGVGTVMQGSYSYVAPNGELIEVRSVLRAAGAAERSGQISPQSSGRVRSVIRAEVAVENGAW